jgi:sensor domain CHASE-containing protein
MTLLTRIRAHILADVPDALIQAMRGGRASVDVWDKLDEAYRMKTRTELGALARGALSWAREYLASQAAEHVAIIRELCSAIETHPLDRTNDFVENARKRARDFLEANGHG